MQCCQSNPSLIAFQKIALKEMNKKPVPCLYMPIQIQYLPIVRMSLIAFSENCLDSSGKMGDNEEKARAMVQDAEKKLASKPGFLSGIFG